ncbi:MAG: M3 family oligoendopeptidase [Chloroflexi bacterium]|nr:M3 family oligoendopeptidase [Chloroflexota bacterium]
MVDAAAEKKTGAEDILWDLSIFYPSTDAPAIQADLDKVQAMADEFAAKYRGKVATLDAEEMVDALIEQEAIADASGRIGSFAFLNYATDTADPKLGALVQKITEAGAQLSQKLLFFDLEWKDVPDEQAQKLLADPTLGKYKHPLEAERRYKPYMLSEAEEKILVEKSVTGSNAWVRLFTQITSAMRYTYDGEQLTQSQILAKLHDTDREVREKAADSLTEGLRSRSMELTFIFNVLAADKASDDKRRGYESWISSRNLSNKAPDEVVEALIKAVTSRYELVARHYNLKRILLGYDELYDYDRYAPIPVKGEEAEYSWDEARAVVESAYNAFSPRLGGIVREFFDKNWIHAALMPNKRGGAFASPTVPSAHPFVFLNFTGQTRDVMTLAHELGHGMHMYLSAEAQGITGLYTPLTTAEMASTFGEMLTFTDLTAKEPDPAVRLQMLAGKIEDSFATIFRQISMNRFENGLHTARRSEGELSTERISEIWMDSQKDMFQGSVNLRDQYALWWSYVPHFLGSPGYVYAYSFGELLVLALFNLYQKRGAEFVPDYLDVLAAGDSDYPDKILAKAGVNLSDPAFWDEGLDALQNLVDQEEALAREVYPDKFAK